jgi:murein DD-endopeptidase MepM/ murein hydrolase activator NlpD
MRIRLLGKSLIPYVYASNEIPVFELLVHGLSVANDASGPLEVESIELALERGSEALVTHRFARRRLGRALRIGADLLARCGRDRHVAAFCFSRGLSPRTTWADSPKPAPGESLALVHQFLVTRGPTPTRLAVTVRASGDETRRAFRLRPYEGRNRLRFPVPGISRAFNGPATGVSHHRFTTSQEFAYDILPCTSRFRLARGDGRRNRCFHGYRTPLLAPAPGRVITALDGLPENETAGESPPLSPERIERWGFLHAVAGNLVVIAHRHGEYSFMAHCANGSLLVGEGDRVRRGQQVALLGNTGNSTGPHLHYHLMDGPDLLRARSLPVTFSDIGDAFDDGETAEEFAYSPAPIVRTLSGSGNGR